MNIYIVSYKYMSIYKREYKRISVYVYAMPLEVAWMLEFLRPVLNVISNI
jgi:hypothetical protein